MDDEKTPDQPDGQAVKRRRLRFSLPSLIWLVTFCAVCFGIARAPSGRDGPLIFAFNALVLIFVLRLMHSRT